MVEIKRSFLLFLFILASCSSGYKFSRDFDNLVIFYTPYTSINFRTDSIKQNMYREYKFEGRINFTADERDSIIETFNSKDIGSLQGYHLYDPNHSIVHADAFKVRVYSKEKLRSEIIIAYDAKSSKYWPFGEENNVIVFKELIFKILKRKKELESALNIEKEFFRYVEKVGVQNGKVQRENDSNNKK